MNSLNSDLTNYDWRRWQHTEIGTLVFIVRAGRIPLIRKQRGLGAGKINGPGDRMESGEDALTCAVRELEEELVARPPGLTWAGDLGFQFTSGFSMLVHVVRSSDVAGKPLETAEAAPSWVSVDDIPYDEMCADDRHWMPFLLRHVTYRGRFGLDEDRIVHQTPDRLALPLTVQSGCPDGAIGPEVHS